jgi:hypothetical protein
MIFLFEICIDLLMKENQKKKKKKESVENLKYFYILL